MALSFDVRISGTANIQQGLIGGALLSLSTVGLLLSTGKSPGISGILNDVLAAKNAAHWGWRRSFIAGLFCAGMLVSWRSKGEHVAQEHLSPALALVCGMLTGVGTRMAGGCTSGHGIFGLSRLSLRSLAAVCTFILTGMVSASLCARPDIYPLLMSAPAEPVHAPMRRLLQAAGPTLAASLYAVMVFRHRWWTGTGCSGLTNEGLPVRFVTFLCSLLFGWGLHVSGLTDPAKIKGFLNPWAREGWDPTLLAVMGSTVCLTCLSFSFLSTVHAPPLLWRYAGTIEPFATLSASVHLAPKVPWRSIILNMDLLLGSALFGIGWGISGVCPGPAIVSAPMAHAGSAWVLPGIIIGMVTYEYFYGKATDCRVCSFEHVLPSRTQQGLPAVAPIPLKPPHSVPIPDLLFQQEPGPGPTVQRKKAGRSPQQRSPAGYRARSASRGKRGAQ